jgi:MFS family permease
MKKKEFDKEVKKSLNYSIKDGASASAMGGITDTYTTPFALALGANNATIGLLNSIPRLFQTLVQPLANKYINIKNRKKATEILSLVGRLVWAPIILLPFIFIPDKVLLLIVVVTISNMFSSVATTAWSSWTADLVPEKIRGKYFGKRNMIASGTAFLTTIIGGYILGLFNTLTGFSIIFTLAVLCGLLSNYFLTKIIDPGLSVNQTHRKISLKVGDFIKDFKKYRNFSTFTMHMTFLNFAVYIASPFFIVYMLEVMKIGYAWYAVSVAATVITTMLFQQYWGRLADKFGDRTILGATNILVVFYPLFFLFVRNPIDIVLISIYSGFVWSGFDLTSFNYLLDVTPPDKRVQYIGNYKLFTNLALFAAPLIGGFLAQYANLSISIWSGLQVLFIISFALRFLSTVVFIPRLNEVRVAATKVLPVENIFWKVVAVYPVRGLVHELSYSHHIRKRMSSKVKKWLG